MLGKLTGRIAGMGLVVLVVAAPAPVRAQTATPTAVSAASYLVIDAGSGAVLAARDPDRQLPVASLQKMISAIVVMERAKLTDVVKISRAASRAQADRIIWPEGKIFTVEELLYGLIVESSNGAAVALAEHVSGSSTAFAGLMNAKAVQLGASRSHFVNASGLDASGQFSTARDMVLVTQAFLADETLSKMARTFTHDIPWPNGTVTTLHTINRFLLRYPGALGVKTGYTSVAGNCIAAAARRNGRTLLAVVVRATSATDDATALMNATFERLGPGAGADDTTPAAPPPAVTAGSGIAPEPSAEPDAADSEASVSIAATEPPTPVSRRPSIPGLGIVFATTGVVVRRRLLERRLNRR